MKRKLLILFMAAILLLTGCVNSTDSNPTIPDNTTEPTIETTSAEEFTLSLPSGFSAGWSRVTITPAESVPLDGVGSGFDRMPNKIDDDLTATLIAVSDGQSVALICTVDNLYTHENLAAEWAAAISQATTVPAENIFFSATHTHSAPDLDESGKAIQDYIALVNNRLVAGAKEALNDLSAATIQAGDFNTSKLTFVRRYLLSDGTYDSTGSTKGTEVAHEGEPDEQLQMVRFVRADKKDILLANWQTHPGNAASQNKKVVSADFIGVFRKRVEKKEKDILCAFFQGAAGDLNPGSRLPSESRATNYQATGQILADDVRDALPSLQPVDPGAVKISHGTYEATVDPAKGGGTKTMPLSAVSIGSIAFVNCPYEMFCANGLAVKTQSPFDMTFVCTNSGGNYGYIPSQEAFPHGAFEVEKCQFVSGTAEGLVNKCLELLGKLK